MHGDRKRTGTSRWYSSSRTFGIHIRLQSLIPESHKLQGCHRSATLVAYHCCSVRLGRHRHLSGVAVGVSGARTALALP